MKCKKGVKNLIALGLVLTCVFCLCACSLEFTKGEYKDPMTWLRAMGISFSAATISTLAGLALGYALFLISYSRPKLSTALDKIQSLFTLLPSTTWIIFCFYIIFAGNSDFAYLSCVFALAITLASTVRSEFVTAIDSVSKGELEAAISIGYTDKQTLKNILIPQIFPKVLDSMAVLLRFHVKDTSLLGLVYVADLQFVADHIQAEAYYPAIPIIIAAVFYVLLALAFSESMIFIKDNLRYGKRSKEEILDRIMRGMI